ncbi:MULTISPECIES: ABC transporter ATP-binding protein [Halomonas]|uniref:NitT/TauT family transport system ATP-binding protein/sulfonate transport system ATP-binding protein n=1 Tax=Halomonas ventosae TaxID=229007 RepID=A0A4R6HMS5_9GAMM|nr:ABC transporter ATP-binding protein [Halomonas ventosae]TDO09914.1 NitT/TauT family transport system ATP-binding protein/sulfonate transport system ATP-binding protein [Halomonas ventosae]
MTAIAKGLSVGHISKSFTLKDSHLEVLSNIDLEIAAGEFVAIIGASGSGKTTLLRILAGLEQADSGTIHLNGQSIQGVGSERAMVFQEPRLLPWLTVEANVALGLELIGENSTQALEKARHYLDIVGLTAFYNAYPRQLSGGMAQRVGIARGLAISPEILLLDEPLGALDAMKKIRMQQELERIWREQAITMVMVTHDIEEAVYLADRIVILSSDQTATLQVMNIDLPRPRQRSDSQFVAYREALLKTFHLNDTRHTTTATESTP